MSLEVEEKVTPAQALEGLLLAGGWRVLRRLRKPEGQSGGFFSQGYVVRRESDGKDGFLKALDYSKMMVAANPAQLLFEQTRAFNFEKTILGICRDRRLDRVVEVIDDGVIVPPSYAPTEVVQYLIFELADGDARSQADEKKRYSISWVLRTLHHVSIGLMQLHGQKIAHQDLKPSNVLTFGGALSKIGDLGCASSRAHDAPRDDCQIAGDQTYAPPEFLYGSIDADWSARRVSCDQYLLGSLVCSFFQGMAMTPLVQRRLHSDHKVANWTGKYDEALPYLQHAFESVIEDLQLAIGDQINEKAKQKLVLLVSYLCNPDPSLRGHPSDMRGNQDRYSLQRFVAAFDLLAREAEATSRRAT